MCYKKFGHYLILFIIKQIILEAFVNIKTMGSETSKTFLTDYQLQYLADSVCPDLVYINKMSIYTCQEEFWNATFPPSNHPSLIQKNPLKIKCTTAFSVRFLIDPSDNWQLVFLLPETTNDTEADTYNINYSLIEPRLTHGKALINPKINYTIWTTVLAPGAHLHWQGGDYVPLYNELEVPEHMEYDVKVQFYPYEMNNTVILNGLFTWNTSGDGDVCFDVVNSCVQSGIEDATIWPDEKPRKVFTNFSIEDKCNIQIKGLHGTTKFVYSTPFCINVTNCMPEIPQNVTIEASEDTFDTWNVFVSWSTPNFTVELYNVTLFTNLAWSQIIDGNNTTAVFKGVTGEGYYYVTVRAILGKYVAHTSRRAIFPVRLEDASGGRIGRALVLGGGVSAIVGLALICLWRRKCRHVPPTHYPSEIKIPKEDDTESLSMMQETWDHWEIRPDKLLLHEVIGEGAFGVVRRATLAPSGTNVAVKMLKEFPSLEEIRSFRSEMELMKSVGVHPHLVNLVGCCSGRRPFIIAEYCSRGDLLTYLRCTWDIMMSKRNAKYYNNNIDISDYRNRLFKSKLQMNNSKLVVNKLYELQEICDRELTSLDLLSFCRQIAIGMEFLASNRVVHRDLAARNILVTEDRTLKIADFGLSRDVYEENQYKQKGNGKMPVKWMALESLTRRIFTTQSDVWSFGVVVWEVATMGASPYPSVPAARLSRLLRAGYRMPRPANCSPQLYDIMLSCWRLHPRDRPTFAELHSRLDELLNSASAHHYLTLELDPLDAPPTPKHHRYLTMLIRGQSNWTRGEIYERPRQPKQSNHYTSPPVVHA